jgi:hypothetical protein
MVGIASVANWRSRGYDPADYLTGKEIDIRPPGVTPSMRSLRAKVRYALAKMKNPIFRNMKIPDE